jgi:hypothetical protein
MAYPAAFGKARDQKSPFAQQPIISHSVKNVDRAGLRCGAAAHSPKAKWPRTQLLPANAVVVTIAAMLMVVMTVDADSQAHRADVRADNGGVGGARNGQGEQGRDQELHS